MALGDGVCGSLQEIIRTAFRKKLKDIKNL